MATREQIGEGTPSCPAKRRWRFPFRLIHRLEPGPGQEMYYTGFSPGWWKYLFKRPPKPKAGPGQEMYYTGFSPGWWKYLFKRPPKPKAGPGQEMR